jgi:hypothetical protein
VLSCLGIVHDSFGVVEIYGGKVADSEISNLKFQISEKGYGEN